MHVHDTTHSHSLTSHTPVIPPPPRALGSCPFPHPHLAARAISFPGYPSAPHSVAVATSNNHFLITLLHRHALHTYKLQHLLWAQTLGYRFMRCSLVNLPSGFSDVDCGCAGVFTHALFSLSSTPRNALLITIYFLSPSSSSNWSCNRLSRTPLC